MFLTVSSWWNSNNEFQRILFIVAAAATLVMIVQIVLMVIGLGGDDASFDYDGGELDDVDLANDEGIGSTAGLRLLSMRSALAFLAIGGWMAYTIAFVLPWWAALLIGIGVGAIAAVGVAFLLKSFMKLQSDGNITLKNAIGKVGEVYLTVPASRQGSGKVNITVQDTLIEREAVTDFEEPIKTGQKVRVVGAIDESTVVVEPLK